MTQKAKPSVSLLDELIAEKSFVLSKAQALGALGMAQTVQPLWVSAAALEERIASLLDAYGEDLEAAVHRLSAASCYDKAGDPSRATNLYRAALAGPLREVTPGGGRDAGGVPGSAQGGRAAREGPQGGLSLVRPPCAHAGQNQACRPR
jgi:hypothetical protein